MIFANVSIQITQGLLCARRQRVIPVIRNNQTVLHFSLGDKACFQRTRCCIGRTKAWRSYCFWRFYWDCQHFGQTIRHKLYKQQFWSLQVESLHPWMLGCANHWWWVSYGSSPRQISGICWWHGAVYCRQTAGSSEGEPILWYGLCKWYRKAWFSS